VAKGEPDLHEPTRSDGRGPILVVEDDADIRETIAAVLAEEGHALALAADGAEALKVLRGRGPRPRLILLDLMMPVMNAWELRTELLKDEELAAIPIVVFSGDAHVADKAASLGAADVLIKPISLANLLEVVARF